MTAFAVRVTSNVQGSMLNICDAELLGREIVQGDLRVSIDHEYYGERLVDEEEAKALLMSSPVINMAGSGVVSLSAEIEVGNTDGVKTIGGVPFLIVFKM
jgi:hypothetical protein